jgi:hypothetical protein
MAMSFEQFMEATGAELVCGNIVVGFAAGRKKVGALGDDGVFNLNEDGLAMVEALESPKRGGRPKKADETTADDKPAE